MTALLAIDPGTTQSGWVLLEQGKITGSGIWSNEDVLRLLVKDWGGDLAIEWFESYGATVGRETFESVRWIGRFQQAYRDPDSVSLVSRRAVKRHVCGTTAAKDPNVRQALLDLFGPQGRKSEPGPTYGISKDMWAALGVAATVRGLR